MAMELDSHVTLQAPHGCWTCKLRRKKCDGNLSSSACNNCAALRITCHKSQTRPEWMDGGARQERMAEEVKCNVKENAHRRRGQHSVNIFSAQPSISSGTQDGLDFVPQEVSFARQLAIPEVSTASAVESNIHQKASSSTSPDNDWRQSDSVNRWSKQLDRPDSILISFYLENLFPFFFPFHQPSGGRSWLLELILNSPVVRQATLCQSSYYISLAQDASDGNGAWERVLAQTKDAFGVLGQALKVINEQGITQEHRHGAVRILTSIMQLQRFEVALLSFNNCRAHLNAAVALFQQLLESESQDTDQLASARVLFDCVLARLGPSSYTLLNHNIQVSSAEQTAFHFSSTLLVFQDIIASTVLQEPPQLYDYHDLFLGSELDRTGSTIDFQAVVGCENWVLIHIGQIAALDAWKQSCKRAGNLDMMQLVQRATPIKEALETNFARLETHSESKTQDTEPLSLLHLFRAQRPQIDADQKLLVTRVWAHATLAYLSVVVSGWQPASPDLQLHVQKIINLLHQTSPPGLLRIMVWPFCVAGCLAEPAQEIQFQRLAQALQPPSVFGTLHKALEITEEVWRSRGAAPQDRDLSTCFRSQGELVLLV